MISFDVSSVRVGEPLAGAAKASGHKNIIAAKLDESVVDLHTPIAVVPKKAEWVVKGDAEALFVVRHSAAHVVADAVKQLFPDAQITVGPATESGFYYDIDYAPGFSEADLSAIEDKARSIIATKAPFRREPIDRQSAIQLFEKMGERYKPEIIAGIPATSGISVYRHNDFVDLCRGPHVPSLSYIGAIKLTHAAGAYWRGDERNKMLRRVYGTAFFSEADLKKHFEQLEEAKKRDHRKLGRDLELFDFHPWAPASPFFQPKGATVYNELIAFMRRVHLQNGYQEVVTPQIFSAELFKKSGHYANYRQNMYDAAPSVGDPAVGPPAEGEAATGAALPTEMMCKAMNCPAHFLMFGMHKHSYRNLPLRLADFGRLHRYERSGVTAGLVRVRSFSQDDAHIFCAVEQVGDELRRFIELCGAVYRALGIDEWHVELSTRPLLSMGTDALWQSAEATLKGALEAQGLPFKINPGEGAFYGPKVEFHVKDALNRSWQLGTIQVDIAGPENFDLSYVGSDNTLKRPVILHRAILGSLERFLGVYLEHTGGQLPAWLAPEQVRVITISEEQVAYGNDLLEKCRKLDMRATLDSSGDKLGAKIRDVQLMKVPFALVVGKREAEAGQVAIRRRGGEDLGVKSWAEAAALLAEELKSPVV